MSYRSGLSPKRCDRDPGIAVRPRSAMHTYAASTAGGASATHQPCERVWIIYCGSLAELPQWCNRKHHSAMHTYVYSHYRRRGQGDTPTVGSDCNCPLNTCVPREHATPERSLQRCTPAVQSTRRVAQAKDRQRRGKPSARHGIWSAIVRPAVLFFCGSIIYGPHLLE